MRLTARIICASVLSLSLLLVGGLWLVRQALDEGHTSTGARHETMHQTYFYHEIGTSRPEDSLNHATQTDMPAKQFTVELAVTRDRSRAESMVKSLHDRGVEAYFTPFNHQGTAIFRVSSGMFSDHGAAQKKTEQLKEQHDLKARVRQL